MSLKKSACVVHTLAFLGDHNNRCNDTKSSIDRNGTTIKTMFSPGQDTKQVNYMGDWKNKYEKLKIILYFEFR
jgi:hypothetical protein